MEDNGQNLNLYPNPVKDIFSLTKEVESGILYDLRGVKVYEFKNQYQDIDVSSMENGLYLLEVIFKNGSKRTLKLLKQ